MSDDLVEKVARAICQAGSDPDEVFAENIMWTGWKDEARAAIAAVVRALRDETEMRSCACRFWLDEILGDAGEKVGTHGSPELDEDARKLEAMGQDPGPTFATDPAPAVCEWTAEPLVYVTGCEVEHTYYDYDSQNRKCCPSCGKHIKFTEVKE